MNSNLSQRPIGVLICALGGEGGGVLSEWLVEAALHAGFPVQSTSIPGVAQRTGATTYYVEIFPVANVELGGRRPVLSLYPVPGALDLIVSSELLETVRQVQLGMADPVSTHVLSSSQRTLTTNERMQMGDGRIDSAELEQVVGRNSREHQIFDMAAIATRCGTVVSAVMFGALAASGSLPFGREACELAIGSQGKTAARSRSGFDAAFDTVTRLRQGDAAASFAPAPAQASRQSPPTTAIESRFPNVLHEIVALGHARVLEYQDQNYADLYQARLERVLVAEQQGPGQDGQFRATADCARYLALWMAFDDIVRVAELKARRSRVERVRREVKVSANELLALYDFFKPGVAEIAGLLPSSLAHRLIDFDRRRQRRGHEALSVPVKLRSNRISGLLALRFLASLKWLRRRGLRFAEEQQAIERWLAAIESGLAASAALGYELAACGRLIKGYGATNERGKANLLHLISALADSSGSRSPADRARAIADARQAALQDDAGTALDRALVKEGASPRPIAAVPLRFQRRIATNDSLAVVEVARK